MANPPGTLANRWNQAVSAIAGEMGWTTTVADTWLNTAWESRYAEGTWVDVVAHDRFRKFLEARDSTSVTLPRAFEALVT
jgi:hypothetical protein